MVYSALGEKQKALDYFNQALPILRAIGARPNEATTLNNIGYAYDDLGEMLAYCPARAVAASGMKMRFTPSSPCSSCMSRSQLV